MNSTTPTSKPKISAANTVIRPKGTKPICLKAPLRKKGSKSDSKDRSIAATDATTRPSPAADEAFIAGLRKMVAASGTNKNELAVNVIFACLYAGINTGPEIRRITTILGFDHVHIRIQLKLGAKERRWARTEDGIYSDLATTA
jgi:hypothetical protein